MKKTLVFLALVLVLALACGAASAVTWENTQSMHWEDTAVTPWSLIGTQIKIDGQMTTVTRVEIYKEPTCTAPAQWKIYYKDLTGNNAPNLYVVGYFAMGYNRSHMGHVWAGDAQWDQGIISITKNPNTGIYTVTYQNGMTTELHGEWIIKNPTCTEKGEAYDFCVYCGTVNTATTRIIQKLDHDYVETLFAFPDCKNNEVDKQTGYLKQGASIYKCSHCGAVKTDATGAAIKLRLKWWTDPQNVAKGIRLVSETGKDFTDAYKKLGYEVNSGHKWDGWAPGATACIQQRHCLICEQTQDKVGAPVWGATGIPKTINCYLTQQGVICTKCNGTTPGHEAHIRFFYAGDATEAQSDFTTIPAGTESVNGAMDIYDLWAMFDAQGKKWIGPGSIDLEYLNTHAEVGETKEHHAFHARTLRGYTTKDDMATILTAKPYLLGVAGKNFCVDGYNEVYSCAKCGKNDIYISHGPDGHAMTEWQCNYAPGAGDNVEGEWQRRCTRCNAVEKYHGTTAPSNDYWEMVQDTENGLQFKNGAWGWYKEGNLQIGVNDLMPYNGSWFLLKDGILDSSFTGLYKYDGAWFYITNGQLRNDLKGIVCCPDGIFRYFGDGMLQNEATAAGTLVQYDGAWFYCKNGVIDFTFSGAVVYDGATFNVVNGEVVF